MSMPSYNLHAGINHSHNTPGKLSDIYGRKRMFMLKIALFVFASMLCGYQKQ